MTNVEHRKNRRLPPPASARAPARARGRQEPARNRWEPRLSPPGRSALDSAPAVSPLSIAILNRLSASAPMIEVSALTKCYGDFTAVRDLSFAVQPGEVLGLVGPNGAGKTTTLRCLTGIIPPTRGTIRLGGIDLAADPVAAKRQLAFFPDEPRLFEHLTVWQHLVFTARLYQVRDFEARGHALLEQLAIADKAAQLPGELSRGMKQKLTLACGLLHAPRVILFDEPLTGLDPAGIRSMKDTMRRLAREGAALILSSHLLSLLEEVCSHVLILKNGVKIAGGSLDDVRRRFAEHADASLEEVFFKATDDPPAVTAGPGPEPPVLTASSTPPATEP